MLSEKQTKELKNSIISQIESKLSGKSKEDVISNIKSMNSKELEEFVKQNSASSPQDIFRKIIDGKIPSYKIDETPEAIAVLEINPISKGHLILIPKKQITNPNLVPKEIVDFSAKMRDKIQSTFNPKKVEALNTTMFGEIIVNILPVYNRETMDSPRNQASEDELKELQKILTEKTKEEKLPSLPEKEEVDSKKIWLPKRIP